MHVVLTLICVELSCEPIIICVRTSARGANFDMCGIVMLLAYNYMYRYKCT